MAELLFDPSFQWRRMRREGGPLLAPIWEGEEAKQLSALSGLKVFGIKWGDPKSAIGYSTRT